MCLIIKNGMVSMCLWNKSTKLIWLWFGCSSTITSAETFCPLNLLQTHSAESLEATRPLKIPKFYWHLFELQGKGTTSPKLPSVDSKWLTFSLVWENKLLLWMFGAKHEPHKGLFINRWRFSAVTENWSHICFLRKIIQKQTILSVSLNISVNIWSGIHREWRFVWLGLWCRGACGNISKGQPDEGATDNLWMAHQNQKPLKKVSLNAF